MPQRCARRSRPSAGGAWGRGWGSAPRLQLILLTLLLGLGGQRTAAARRGPGGSRAALLHQVQPLVDKGVAALLAKDFAAATKALSSAYRGAPVPEVLLQLARLAQAEGRSVDSYDLYRRYLSDPTRIPDDAAVRETEAVLAAAPPESGSLTIIGPPSALVLIDDRLVGVLPLPQPLLVAAGKHTLVLDLGGKRLDTPLQTLAGRLSEVRTGKSSGALLISQLPALLVFDEWPGVAAETLRPFTDAIERAAIGQQLGVMPAAVALRQGAELKPCLATLPCQQQLAKRSSLDYVLRSRVVREASPGQPLPPGATPTAMAGPNPSMTATASPTPGSSASPRLTATANPTPSASLTPSLTAAASAPPGPRPPPAPGPLASPRPTPGPSSPPGPSLPLSAGPPPTPPASPTANWKIELALVHVEVSDPAGTAAVTCPACTTEQAAARYREALSDLLTRGLPRQFGTAQLTSEPTAAAVALAGNPIGKTPLHLSLWEGSYELKLTLPGYQPAESTLAVAAGRETALSVPLAPPEVAAAPAPLVMVPMPQSTARLPRPRWRLALGGALLSLGAVVVFSGGAAGSLNGQCVPSSRTTMDAECKKLYDTTEQAWITIGAGLAFGIAGTILMAIPGPRPN